MNVAVIGDSHAEGLSVSMPRKLRDAGHNVVLFEHHRGWSTRRMLENNVFSRAANSGADVIIVSSGTNDSVDETDSPIRNSMNMISNKRVIWFLPGPYRHDRGERQRQVARSKLIRLFPTSYVDANRPQSELSGDGLHYTRRGYESIADFLIGQINISGKKAAGVLSALILGIVIVLSWRYLRNG